MSSERKKGHVMFEGANPMAIVELNDEPADSWTPEQEAVARAVSQAIKSYLKTTKDLAEGRYGHLRGTIPEYMVSPGNVLIGICADGVVVRYEKKVHDESKWIVAFIPQGINESPKLRIMTYDDVYENAKAVFENLLGPIWDTGGATQIYYPQPTPRPE